MTRKKCKRYWRGSIPCWRWSGQENDITITLLLSYFEGNDNGNDIAQRLHPYRNVEIGGNVGGCYLGLSSEFSRGNIATGDVGLPFDVTKQWPVDFNP
ncbi:hypothetical protein Q3G72_024221 [Acer saccharum]|nr:hypothetical protein Q3G72_024221 [Acer saccharum]